MTSTQTPAPTLVDPVDRTAVVEQAQRDYAAEHTIELNEDEFALAKADALVRIQRGGLPATETRLIRYAHASIRAVASGSGRRRPLTRFDLIRVWLTPLLTALLTGFVLWSVRDLRDVVSTAQYPSWLPSEVIDALPRNMDWFWVLALEVGGLATLVGVVAAASATWRTHTYRTVDKLVTTVGLVLVIVLVAILAAAATWSLGMTHLVGAGGGQ
jgi:hypothetical protein